MTPISIPPVPITRECRDCGAQVVQVNCEREYVKTAPGWHYWPVPPPDSSYDQHIPVRDHITETCVNGHDVTYWRPVAHEVKP